MGRGKPAPTLLHLIFKDHQRRRRYQSRIASRRRRLNSTVATRRNGLVHTYPALKPCHYPNLFSFAPEAQRILAGGASPSASTHVRRSGITRYSEPGHLFKIIEVVMFKQLNRRQEDPKTSQDCRSRSVSTPDLPSAQSHQQIAQRDGLLIGCALNAPNHDAGHCRNQQTFANRINNLLLPLVNLEAVALKQLEVRFDSPTPVIPFSELLGANLNWRVTEQVPFGLNRFVKQAQLANHQTQFERLTLDPPALAVARAGKGWTIDDDAGFAHKQLPDHIGRDLHRLAWAQGEARRDLAQQQAAILPDNSLPAVSSHQKQIACRIPLAVVKDRVALAINDVKQRQRQLLSLQKRHRLTNQSEWREIVSRLFVARRVPTVLRPQSQRDRYDRRARQIADQQGGRQFVAPIRTDLFAILLAPVRAIRQIRPVVNHQPVTAANNREITSRLFQQRLGQTTQSHARVAIKSPSCLGTGDRLVDAWQRARSGCLILTCMEMFIHKRFIPPLQTQFKWGRGDNHSYNLPDQFSGVSLLRSMPENMCRCRWAPATGKPVIIAFAPRQGRGT